MSAAETAPRRRVRTLAIALFLLLAGVLAGVLFAQELSDAVRTLRFRISPPTDAEWEEQVREDAATLAAVLAPNESLPDELPGEFWEAWNPRRRLYTDARLADLRRRLDGYLDFLQAEFHDAAETWRTAPRSPLRSDAARDLREQLRRDFGGEAERMIAQADALHEDAYRHSPLVIQPAEGDPDYAQMHRDILLWLPRAHARAAELTAPLR